MTKCPTCKGSYERLGQHWSVSTCDGPEMFDYLIDVATGVLMGDGSIGNRDRKNPYLEVKTVTPEYAIYLDSTFGPFSSGVSNTGKQSSSYTDSDVYRWSTWTHSDLSRFCDWYENSDKHIPAHVRVNDVVLSHWYVCDGSLDNKGRMHIISHNDKDRIETLADLIDYPTYTYDSRIIIARRGADQFFDSTQPISGYEHKWP